MKIVIDIDDMAYKFVQDTSFVEDESTMFKQTNADRKKTLFLFGILDAIKNGEPLPDGAEILTKEAYSDLCIRADDVPGTNVGELISRQAVEGKLKKVVDEMALIFADIREKNVDDSVCGLCEYDCDHGIDGFANECPGFERDDCFKLKEECLKEWTDLSDIPFVEPERKPGKWIDKGIIGNTEAHDFMCSECGWHEQDFPERISELHYCTNCGRRMEVDG